MVIITEVTGLSDTDTNALVDLYSEAFEQDRAGISYWGAERADALDLWNLALKNDVIQAAQHGSVVLARSESGEIVAASLNYKPGQEIPDEPGIPELKDMIAAMPAEQKAFRAKFAELSAALRSRELPANYERDNLYVYQFAVAKAHHRQGLGSQLMQYIIKQAGSQNGILLDTSKWENVLFYQANGLQLKGSFEIEHYKFGPVPRMYTLVREAKESG